MSVTSIIVNVLFRRGDVLRDRDLITPDNIKRHDNQDYYGDKIENHMLDVYYPSCEKKSLPTIISVHGGGWVYGNKEVYQFYCMNLARSGFTVVNFNYRLAPEYKFPAALEDINAVFHWVKENAEMFHIDLNNLFVVGDSAGAQIASQYTVIITNVNYAKMFDLNTPNIKIKALGLNCGMFDPLDRVRKGGNILVKRFLKNLLRDYLGKEIYKYEKEMDFQSNITSDYPPAFITCSVNDILVGCKPALLDNLRNAGITYIYREYGHNDRSNNHVFHLDIRKEEAIKLNNEQIEFFRQYIT